MCASDEHICVSHRPTSKDGQRTSEIRAHFKNGKIVTLTGMFYGAYLDNLKLKIDEADKSSKGGAQVYMHLHDKRYFTHVCF